MESHLLSRKGSLYGRQFSFGLALLAFSGTYILSSHLQNTSLYSSIAGISIAPSLQVGKLWMFSRWNIWLLILNGGFFFKKNSLLKVSEWHAISLQGTPRQLPWGPFSGSLLPSPPATPPPLQPGNHKRVNVNFFSFAIWQMSHIATNRY